MKIFKFNIKKQNQLYSILTLTAIALGILYIIQWDDAEIISAVAFLVVSIMSFISSIIFVKKANKTFSEINIDENKIIFHFSNIMKNKFIKEVSEVILIDKGEFLEVKDKKNNSFIGRAYKNRMENPEKWEVLINLLKEKK